VLTFDGLPEGIECEVLPEFVLAFRVSEQFQLEFIVSAGAPVGDHDIFVNVYKSNDVGGLSLCVEIIKITVAPRYGSMFLSLTAIVIVVSVGVVVLLFRSNLRLRRRDPLPDRRY
jgi:hypothetical protein